MLTTVVSHSVHLTSNGNWMNCRRFSFLDLTIAKLNEIKSLSKKRWQYFGMWYIYQILGNLRLDKKQRGFYSFFTFILFNVMASRNMDGNKIPLLMHKKCDDSLTISFVSADY